jgi:hypothetical protein
MTEDAALELSYDLRRQTRGGHRLRADVKGGRIVFSGGNRGTHSIDIGASSQARVLAHWEGYCENNGMPVPLEGEKIRFVGGTGTIYTGNVIKVGSKRVTVDFRYKHGGSGTANIPFSDILY